MPDGDTGSPFPPSPLTLLPWLTEDATTFLILLAVAVLVGGGIYGYESLAARRQAALPWFARVAEEHGLTLERHVAEGNLHDAQVALVLHRALHLTVAVKLRDFPYTVGQRDPQGLRPRLHGGNDELERLSYEGPQLRREWRMYATSAATAREGILGEQTHRWDARRCLRRLLRTARLVSEARDKTRDERLLSIIVAHQAADVCVDIARAVARHEPEGALARWWRARLDGADEKMTPAERAVGAIALGRSPDAVEALEAVVANAYLAFDGDRLVARAWLELAADDRVLQLDVVGSDLPEELIALALEQLEATGRPEDVTHLRDCTTHELAAQFQQTIDAVSARAGQLDGGQLSVAEIAGGALSEVDPVVR